LGVDVERAMDDGTLTRVARRIDTMVQSKRELVLAVMARILCVNQANTRSMTWPIRFSARCPSKAA
jgi:hypothetical protein